MTHITIIGGGIAGLATAYYLQQKSRATGDEIKYTLIESAPRFGGKIVTDQVDDFIIEGGPDSFITQKPWATQLCRELGLADRLIPTNDERRNIFVLNKGKLVPFPGGYRLTVPTEFIPFVTSPLISPLGPTRNA
ncbi:MAG: oleate hydratase [Chloroflexi bacterium]|nr:oleate hydratase [Chloroflexota bacterium]